MNLLYSLNLIAFYKIMQNQLNKLIDFSKIHLIAIKRLSITILIYNNFEFSKDRRSKRIEKT